MEYYPQLNANIRKFDSQNIDIQRVLKFLMQGKWYRKISAVGQISLFSKKYQVGYQYRNQDLSIKLLLQDRRAFWACYDEKLNLIKQLPAENLNDGSYFYL